MADRLGSGHPAVPEPEVEQQKRHNQAAHAVGPERGGAPDYTGELYAIYLLEGYQRHGLGRHLTSTLVQRLVQAGMPSLLLWVLAANPCRGFYEVLGGQRLYDKQVLIGGAPLVEVAYGWRDARALIVEPRGERERSSGPPTLA